MIKRFENSVIEAAYMVSGLPHILLQPEKSKGWQSLKDSYDHIRKEVEEINPDIILYYSTQWLSVLGYMFQADPEPEWLHVDQNWHDLGEMPYKFKVDTDFAAVYADEVSQLGHNTKLVNYRGFPIDTGTIVAQKLINPDNKFKAAMVSCNMYSEKEENHNIGQAAARALEKYGKKAVAVVVSNLSNRFEIVDIDPAKDAISSLKDDEWNQKILQMFNDGDIEDVSQSAREFSKQANADMGFRGLWWLNGLCGETNNFTGKTFDYQPVWGTGAALVGFYPEAPVRSRSIEECKSNEEASQAQLVDGVTDRGVGGETNQELSSGINSFANPNSSVTSDFVPQNLTGSNGSNGSARVDSSTAPEPVGAYPHARRQGEFLFLSGVGPRKKGTKNIPGVTFDSNGNVSSYDIVTQTKSVIENVETILKDSGKSLDDVVDVQVFLTNMKEDFQKFNKVYADAFGHIGATRTTVEVLSLPTPINVEFKVIAKL